MFKLFKKNRNKMLTVMIVPHSESALIRFHVSKAFLITLFLIFAGFMVWAGFIIHKQIDYWAVSTENRMLVKETGYFTKEMLQTRQMADNLREMDREMQTLLGFKTKKALMQMGGPSVADLDRVTKYLNDKQLPITPQEFKQNLYALASETQALKKNFLLTSTFIKQEKSRWEATPCIWPVKGRITCGFGPRIHPIYGYQEFHPAIDIAAERGTPVKVPANGEVILAEWQPGYGKMVVVDHGWGFKTKYGHLSKILVKQGQQVQRGELIGYVGSTGSATAPHLHYEVLKNGTTLNPKRFLTENILK